MSKKGRLDLSALSDAVIKLEEEVSPPVNPPVNLALDEGSKHVAEAEVQELVQAQPEHKELTKSKSDRISTLLELVQNNEDFGKRVTNVNIDQRTVNILKTLEVVYPTLSQSKLVSLLAENFMLENGDYIKKTAKKVIEHRMGKL